MLGLNVPFNLLYDAGANPEVSYVDGGWEHEAETRETLYEYLAGFGEVPQENGSVLRGTVISGSKKPRKVPIAISLRHRCMCWGGIQTS